MWKPPILSLALFLFLSHWGLASPSPEAESSTTTKPKPIEIGIGVSLLHPDSLPGFRAKLTGFGPMVAIPWGKNAVHLASFYGGDDASSLYLIELAYRFRFSTPFFSGFVSFGPHYLKHTLRRFSALGGHTGLAFDYTAVKKVNVHFGLKLYFQEKLLLGLGGGIAYLL